MESGANISSCGKYRYFLWRRWGPPGAGSWMADAALWVMFNPSTADAEHDDATIRRCIAFSKAWGCVGLCAVNLFAMRTTSPKVLRAATDPIGPLNNITLVTYANITFKHKVGAWGANGGHNARDKVIEEIFSKVELSCLGTTQNGQPKHPLRLSKTTQLRPWRGNS